MTQPTRVIHFTDTHLFADSHQSLLGINTAQSLQAVIKHIKTHEKNKQCTIITGDIAQEASINTYQQFMDLTQPLHAKRLCLAGNHDSLSELHTQCTDLLPTSYDVDEHWRIVMLNTQVIGSNSGFLDQEQLQLLKKACEAAPNKHVIVAMHHNPVPVGSLWLDKMMIANSDQLLLLVKQLSNVQLLLWGHVHQDFDSYHAFSDQVDHTTRYVRLLASPSTCVQFMPRSAQFAVDDQMPGYRWLDLHADGTIDTGVVRVTMPKLQADLHSTGY